MKLLIPISIIGMVGGLIDGLTDLHKVWCFLIGVLTFYLLLFIKSIFTTIKIMKQTKGAKRVWIDQNNNVVKVDYQRNEDFN